MKRAAELDLPWLREPPLVALLAALNRDGEEARVVGGAVRNALIGLPHGDIDVATTAGPAEVTRRADAAGFKAVPTGFEVTPVVGIVPPDLPLIPHPGEVAAMFEAPLHYLLDPAHQHCRTAAWRGQERHYYEIDYEGRRIWGATAAMIVNLSRRLVLA